MITWQLAAKVGVTAIVVVAVSELARRSSFWGALLASLPLTSLLAFVWIHLDTGSAQAVADLSRGIFWLVLASLPLFIVLPMLLTRMQWPFWTSLGAACAVTVVAYLVLVWGLRRAGVAI